MINQVDQQHLTQILESRYFQSQQILGLYHCQDTWQQILQLRDKNWSQLRALNLQNCNVGDDGMNVLMREGLVWGELREFQIPQNGIGERGLRIFLEINLGRGMSNLTLLNLSDNNIGSRGISLLTKANLQNLSFLWIRLCKFNNKGSQTLTKGQWPNLQNLNIYDNKIKIDGYQVLTLGYWKRLQILFVDNPNVNGMPRSHMMEMLGLVGLEAKTVNIDRVIENEEGKKNVDFVFGRRFG